jgi:hypothetical protein
LPILNNSVIDKGSTNSFLTYGAVFCATTFYDAILAVVPAYTADLGGANIIL